MWIGSNDETKRMYWFFFLFDVLDFCFWEKMHFLIFDDKFFVGRNCLFVVFLCVNDNSIFKRFFFELLKIMSIHIESRRIFWLRFGSNEWYFKCFFFGFYLTLVILRINKSKRKYNCILFEQHIHESIIFHWKNCFS